MIADWPKALHPMRGKALVLLPIAAGILTSYAFSATGLERATDRRSYFVALTNFSAFEPAKGTSVGAVVLTSPVMATPLLWDELVLSWNAVTPLGTGLKLEARAIYPDRTTKFFTLGLWSEDPSRLPCESVTGQKDQDGDVQTDILVLQKPATGVQLRLTLEGPDSQRRPELKFLGFSFLNTHAELRALEPNRAAWGKSIPVPERSQVAYRGGRDWCSPTSVSMVLAHWSKVLQRPELDIDVPDVAKAVYDRNWPGTGNWPFNTAYAGRFPGMRGYVTRLGDVAELEDWIACGIPPIVSASFDLLNGKPEDKGSGHLVVCVGFTPEGDVIVNDPWAILDKGERVRRIYARQNLIRAWKGSKNTVYLIYPESAKIPPNKHRHWE